MSGMERLQRMLGIYQAGAGFFAGPGEAWDQPGFRRYFPEMNREEFVLEYDFLFRGTDADVEMVLWASGCSGRGNILWNGTTLEVIKRLRKMRERLPLRTDLPRAAAAWNLPLRRLL